MTRVCYDFRNRTGEQVMLRGKGGVSYDFSNKSGEHTMTKEEIEAVVYKSTDKYGLVIGRSLVDILSQFDIQPKKPEPKYKWQNNSYVETATGKVVGIFMHIPNIDVLCVFAEKGGISSGMYNTFQEAKARIEHEFQ